MDPDLAVALGAAVQAGIYQGEVAGLMVIDPWKAALMRAFAARALERGEVDPAAVGVEVGEGGVEGRRIEYVGRCNGLSGSVFVRVGMGEWRGGHDGSSRWSIITEDHNHGSSSWIMLMDHHHELS